MLFRYNFKMPFLTVCQGVIRKFNWEQSRYLTTIEKVEQLDEDRVLIYRRYDTFDAMFTSWEQVLINR